MLKSKKLKMELLMTVGYIFKGGEKGKRIVGGAEPYYPTDDLSWLNFNGKEVMIQTMNGNLLFRVQKIDIFSSISGAVNIGLTLDDDSQFDMIRTGDKVFKMK